MGKIRVGEAFNYSYEDSFVMEDLNMRHLYLNSEVDENVVNNIIYHIIRFNMIDKEKPIDKRQPIILYINSPGGHLSDGFALVDAITVSKTPVYTVNLGLAASAAFYIFIAGKIRFAMPRSEFLIHEAFIGEVGHLSKVKDAVKFIDNDIENMIRDFVLERTHISEVEYGEKERVEWYMLPNTAKEYGILDYIVGTDCTFDAVL